MPNKLSGKDNDLKFPLPLITSVRVLYGLQVVYKYIR